MKTGMIFTKDIRSECWIKIRRGLLAVLAMILPASVVYAQGCDFGVPVNESYTIDADQIEECILTGQDPPREWIKQLGRSRGNPAGMGAIKNIEKAARDCPATFTSDATCGIGYPDCTGRPGGRSDNGALSVCDKGAGSMTIGLGAPIYLPKIDPQSIPGFDNCFLKFMVSVVFGDSSAFWGIFVDNVVVSGSSSVSVSGACAGGKIGFCGFNVGGQICLKGLDGEDSGDGKFIMMTGSPEILMGEGRMLGPINLLDGGTIVGNTTLQLLGPKLLELSPHCEGAVGVIKAGGSGYLMPGETGGVQEGQGAIISGEKCPDPDETDGGDAGGDAGGDGGGAYNIDFRLIAAASAQDSGGGGGESCDDDECDPDGLYEAIVYFEGDSASVNPTDAVIAPADTITP